MESVLSVSPPLKHDTVLKSITNFWLSSSFWLMCLERKAGSPNSLQLRLSCLSYMFSPPPSLHTPSFGSRGPNKCSLTVTGGLEQPIWFNEVIQCVFSPPLALSIFLCVSLSQLHRVLSRILSPFFFFLLSLIFPPSFLRPCWLLIGLLGIKPGARERRGTFGSEMARGTVATYLHGVLLLALWKPSLQGGGFPSLHVLGAQRCSTCGSGVT